MLQANTLLTNISYSMHIDLLFKIEYVRRIPKGLWIEQHLTQFAVKILFDNSTGCDERDNYFAREADIMKDIIYDLEND